MSGFVVVFHFDDRPVDEANLNRLVELLAYRGPDEQRVWVNQNMGFGHTLFRNTFYCDREHQPLVHQDGSLVLVADARIDDRDTLLSKLNQFGLHQPADASASELIMAAYRAWGCRFLDHLLGDFTFVLWDQQTKKLLAARDHFGKRTLYYAHIPGGLIVSNDIRSILAHPEVSHELDEQSIGRFLLFGYYQWADEHLTPFAKIRSLGKAEVMLADKGGLHIDRYWQFPLDSPILRYRHNQDYADHCRSVLRQATRDRIQTQTLSVSLSGGLDSTTVLALATDIIRSGEGGQNIQAFTGAFGPEDPEFENASATTAQLDVPHKLIDMRGYHLLQPEVESFLPLQVQTPAATLSAYRQISQAGPILLTGSAADNALTPTPITLVKHLITYGLAPTIRARSTLRREFGYTPPLGTGLGWLLKWFPQKSKQTVDPYAKYYPQWLQPDFEASACLKDLWYGAVNMRIDPSHSRHPGIHGGIEVPSWGTRHSYMQPDFTPAEPVDPFLDRRVVEFFLSLPALPWLHKKYIVRAAMKGVLPGGVRRRPKTPAGDLVEDLLKEPQADWVDQWQPEPEIANYVVRSAVPNLFGGCKDGNNYMNLRPLLLNLWLKQIRQWSRIVA